MSEKRLQILNAAQDVFQRYGVRRATMGDIAKAADISRQTLYSFFANKEEIMGATILHLWTKTLEALRAAWSENAPLASKLDQYFEICVIAPFELMCSSPDAADVIAGSNRFTEDAIKEGYKEIVAMLEEELSQYKAAIIASGQTVADLALFIKNTASSYKTSAANREELDRFLKSLRALVLETAKANPN